MGDTEITGAMAALKVFLNHTVPWQLEQTALEAEEQTKTLQGRLEKLRQEVADAALQREWWEIMGCFDLEIRIDDLSKLNSVLRVRHQALQEEHARLLAEKTRPPAKRTRTETRSCEAHSFRGAQAE